MTDRDLELARQLQRQFDQEYALSLSLSEKKSFAKSDNFGQSADVICLDQFEEDAKLAQKLQKELNGEITKVTKNDHDSGKLADTTWELQDPNPDVLALFVDFDRRYFYGKLASVEVIWSKKMTLCAGLCEYHGRRSGMCRIKLSEPLLKFRPRKDLLETLLHEMIHAYLFLTNNDRDRDGHGSEFQKHMHRLNESTGLNITIYHSFHDEVAMYQQHWWLCDGPCRKRPPYFGKVKRAMNRAPSARDFWWAEHASTCGGTFHKVKEPENFGSKKRKLDGQPEDAKKSKSMKIDSYFSPVSKSDLSSSMAASFEHQRTSTPIFQGKNKIHAFSSSRTPQVEIDWSKLWGVGHVLSGKKSSSAFAAAAGDIASELREKRQRYLASEGCIDLTHVSEFSDSSSICEKKRQEEEEEKSERACGVAAILGRLDCGMAAEKEWPKSFPSSLKINTLEEGWKQLEMSNLKIGETIDIPDFVSVSNPEHPVALERL